MGGAVRGPAKILGLNEKLESTNFKDPTPAPAQPTPTQATQSEEMQGARMRGARRRGRQLLSDARLNSTQGETLGGGNNL